MWNETSGLMLNDGFGLWTLTDCEALQTINAIMKKCNTQVLISDNIML